MSKSSTTGGLISNYRLPGLRRRASGCGRRSSGEGMSGHRTAPERRRHAHDQSVGRSKPPRHRDPELLSPSIANIITNRPEMAVTARKRTMRFGERHRRAGRAGTVHATGTKSSGGATPRQSAPVPSLYATTPDPRAGAERCRRATSTTTGVARNHTGYGRAKPGRTSRHVCYITIFDSVCWSHGESFLRPTAGSSDGVAVADGRQ